MRGNDVAPNPVTHYFTEAKTLFSIIMELPRSLNQSGA